MTPNLFAALYRGKSIEKVASNHGLPLSDDLSAEKVALWDRLKSEGSSHPQGTAVGVIMLAAKFASLCLDRGEKIASGIDARGQCISIGTAVYVDDMISKMAQANDLTIKEAAYLRVLNAECSLYELGLLTEPQ